MSKDFYKKVDKIIAEDSRYCPQAYEFIMRALLFTQKRLRRKGHVTAQELSQGIRDLAIEEFGPLARTVLEHWGITKTEDFGEIVFNMIGEKLMGKTEEDSKDDFKDLFDFKQAFDIW
jgi:uncharacterized repeat protein (TIGR04138 family)